MLIKSRLIVHYGLREHFSLHDALPVSSEERMSIQRHPDLLRDMNEKQYFSICTHMHTFKTTHLQYHIYPSVLFLTLILLHICLEILSQLLIDFFLLLLILLLFPIQDSA